MILGRYVTAGTAWLNGAFSKVARAGQVAGTKTREKFNLAVSNLTAKVGFTSDTSVFTNIYFQIISLFFFNGNQDIKIILVALISSSLCFLVSKKTSSLCLGSCLVPLSIRNHRWCILLSKGNEAIYALS